MARDNYKDCLRRLKEAGASIDAQDEARIDALIDAGLNAEDAIRLMFIERHANVVDFVARRKEAGAEIAPYRDTYDEVISRRSIMLARTMQNYMNEQQAIGEQIQAIDEEMDEIHQTMELLEAAGTSFGMSTEFLPGLEFRPTERMPVPPFRLATATDQDLLTLFEVLNFQDRQLEREGYDIGMTETLLNQFVGSPLEAVDAYKAIGRRRSELISEKIELHRRKAKNEERVRAFTDREWRNPDWAGSVDADGNYRMDPSDTDPDGVAEQVMTYQPSGTKEEPGKYDKPRTLQERLDVVNTGLDNDLVPEEHLEWAKAYKAFLEEALGLVKPSRNKVSVPETFMEAVEGIEPPTYTRGEVVDREYTAAVLKAVAQVFKDRGVKMPKLQLIIEMVDAAGAKMGRQHFYLMRQTKHAPANKRVNINAFNTVLRAYEAVLTGDRESFDRIGKTLIDEGRIEQRFNRVMEDTIDYSVTYTTGKPWSITSSGEGDLYISRHGKNAGTPHRERQGPNDFAIKFDQNVLLPDFMFYLFQYLQPEIADRARGTAQQYVTMEDIDQVLLGYFHRRSKQDPPPMAREDQGDIYSDPDQSPERHQAEAQANYKALVGLVEEGTFKVGLDKASTPAEVAHILAPIRSNAQEGFWAVVLDEDDNVLGIIQHAKGGIASTSVFPSIMAGHIYQIPGAKKVWFGHNHPSGELSPSAADQRITQRITNLMRGGDVQVMGHVLTAARRDRFTLMDEDGWTISTEEPITAAPRNRDVPIYNRRIVAASEDRRRVTGPADARAIVETINEEGILFLDNRHNVIGFMAMTAEEMKTLRNTGQGTRILRAQSELNAAAAIGITRSVDPDASSNVAAFANAGEIRLLDFMYRDQDGDIRSMAERDPRFGETQNTFYQDIVGLTSGLLEAAKNLKQEKGPAEQMIATLKKMPGVTKAELDQLQLEDWMLARGGTITRDEIIDFIDKNGVVVQEFWLGDQPNAILQPILDWERIPFQDLETRSDPDLRDYLKEVVGLDEFSLVEGRIGLFSVEDQANDLYFTVVHDVEEGAFYAWDEDTGRPIAVESMMDSQSMDDAAEAIRGAVLARRDRQQQEFVRTPMHTDYTLDGGFNHREVVFRLPNPAGGQEEMQVTGRIIYGDYPERSDDLVEGVRRILGASAETLEWGRIESENIIELERIPVAKWDRIRQMVMQPEYEGIAIVEDGRVGDPDAPTFTRSHAYTDWNNVLMWVRLNERTGPNGERILFIEEIQSDWHQMGRRFGYMQPDTDEQIAARNVRDNAASDAINAKLAAQDGLDKIARIRADQIQDPAYTDDMKMERGQFFAEGEVKEYSNWILRMKERFGDEWFAENITREDINAINAWRQAALVHSAAIRSYDALTANTGSRVTDAPFKDNAWAQLALKRMIRQAVEEGFDQVAWTTGAQQIQRYDSLLAATVEWIEYDIQEGMLRGGGFGESIEEYVSPDDLDEYIGRDMADEIRDQIRYFENNYRVTDASQAGVTWDDIRNEPDAPIDLEDQLYDGKINENDEVDSGYVIEVGGSHEQSPHDQWYFEDEDAAEQAMYQMARDNGDFPEIVGEEIQIGGHGMRGFYDQVLPSMASKALKKLDKKAKVDRFGGEITTTDPESINHLENRVRRWSRIVRELEDRGAGLRWTESQISNNQALEDARNNLIRAQRELDRVWEEPEPVHSIDITEKMIVSAMEGQTLFQRRRRGSITFDENRKAIVRLTKARNLSTFLHESGHLYLELLGDIAQSPGASEQAKADWNKVLKFLGVEDRSMIGRVQHEKFARAFEAYLREGKAPDPALRDAFRAFGAWLKRIYTQLTQLDVELNDDIRGVFDRMIATDQAISQAEQIQEYVTLFTSAEDMGLSPEAFEVYRRNAAEAHTEAVEREQVKVLKAMQQEEMAWWQDARKQVEAEVRAEAYAMKVYRALSMLQRGKNPDGSTPETSSFKISKESLLKHLQGSQATLNRLPRPYIYSVKGGVDALIAAREFGYNTVEEMLTEIMRSKPMEQYIQTETDARMAEQFPDPLVSGELEEAALEVVHNERRAQVMAAEMRALRKRVREDRKILQAQAKTERREQLEARTKLPKRGELRLITEAAKAYIGKMRVRDVRPHTYLMNERKAGRKAFEALGRKDYEKAYEYKRQQIVNHEMYRAALAAKDQAEKTRKYLAKFDRKPTRQKMGKGGVLEQIDALLQQFNFRKVSLKQVDRERAQAELLDAIDRGVIVAPQETIAKLRDMGTNYQDLTVDELNGIRDIIRQLEKQGVAQFEAVVMGEKKNIQQTAETLASTVRENDEVIPLGMGKESKKKRRSGLGDAREALVNTVLNAGAIARILDASKWGSWTKEIVLPIRRAYAERMLPWFHQASEDVVDIYLKHYDNKELRQLNNEVFYIESMGENLTRGEMISVVLNWGSETNRAALLNGKKANGEQAYPEQAIRQIMGKMREKDANFINDIWAYLDTYWYDQKDDQGNVTRPGLSSTEQRRRGFAPPKVDAMPFEIRTTDGKVVQMRGGYYPLRYDPKHSKRTKIQEFEDITNKMGNGVFVSANTRAGATHARVKNHGKPVLLGLNTIDLHLREIIRDIAIGDEINYVKRVLEDPELDRAMNETGNEEALKQLKMWLDDSAAGELPASGAIETALAYSRTGFTKSKIGWNLVTTGLQLTGVFQTAAEMGTWNYAKGVAQASRHPVETWQNIMAKSAFMKERYASGSWNKDVADTRDHLQTHFDWLLGEGPTKARRVTNRLARTYFAPIMAMQAAVDMSTWQAGYTMAINDGKSEQEAVYFADARVEAAQTSGFFSDRSGLERGTINFKTVQSQFIRIWTTLISYMLRKSGIAYEKGVQLRRDIKGEGDLTFKFGQAIKFASDMVLLFTLEGLATAWLYDEWPDEDDDTGMLAFSAKVTAESMISGVPFVRETLNARYGGGNTVVGSLTRDFYTVYQQSAQGEIDAALIKSLNNVGGTLLHYPASQTNRFIDAAWREAEGENVDWYEPFIGERD